MNKLNEYFEKISAWIDANPKKAGLIFIFILGLLIGGFLF